MEKSLKLGLLQPDFFKTFSQIIFIQCSFILFIITTIFVIFLSFEEFIVLIMYLEKQFSFSFEYFETLASHKTI